MDRHIHKLETPLRMVDTLILLSIFVEQVGQALKDLSESFGLPSLRPLHHSTLVSLPPSRRTLPKRDASSAPVPQRANGRVHLPRAQSESRNRASRLVTSAASKSSAAPQCKVSRPSVSSTHRGTCDPTGPNPHITGPVGPGSRHSE